MTLSSSMKNRVLTAVRQQPSPIRRRRVPGWVSAIIAALGMAAVYALWGDPYHASKRPAEAGAWIVIGLAAFAVTITSLVIPPRRSMLPPATSRLLAVAVGVPVIVGAWLVGWHGYYPDPFVRFGLRCFAFTLALAPWPFAALAMAAPRMLPERPWILGGALGAAAGAWAAVVVEIWCPLVDPRHLAIGHIAPLVALVAIGALIGPRLLRARTR